MDSLDIVPKRTSRRWLDMVVGTSAIVIAVISLVVALRQSQIMERQLAASIWPYLQYGTGNGTDDGKKIISFDIENVGVGPAQVHSVSLRYKDKPIHDVRELMLACCSDLLDAKGKPNLWANSLHGQVLAPNRPRAFLTLIDTPENAPYWDRLNAERFKVEFKACYCSVLDQCWMVDSTRDERTPLAACPAQQPDDYNG
ncbi:MAG: hypothetical protein JWR07_4663 [Nevskia sp.]|nr:hypothetical protein [Nevskia sp.]